LFCLDDRGASGGVPQQSSGRTTSIALETERVRYWQHHHRARSHLYILET
jgi:hypothetical protein